MQIGLPANWYHGQGAPHDRAQRLSLPQNPRIISKSRFYLKIISCAKPLPCEQGINHRDIIS